MTADFPILLDACVLANYGVCDLFLRLAETPRLYVPRWSETILDEVRRTQTQKLPRPWPESVADHWRQEVTHSFPEATVSAYGHLIPSLNNDAGDRHVLAAAIHGGVSLIVTFNLRHFQAEQLKPWGIKAVHPQDYLLTLYSMHPGIVMRRLAAIARDKEEDLEDVLIRLGKSTPRFSRHILEGTGSQS